MTQPRLASILAALVAAAWPAGLSAQVRETPVTLSLVEGGNPQGYVQNSNDQGILFATGPGGRGQLMPYERIRGEGIDKLIRFEERADALSEARANFAAARYDEAAESFGAVARNYAIILAAPQNFATEALFYQAESLYRAGRFGELAPVVSSPASQTVRTKLNERYQRRFEFLKLWGLLGAEQLDSLREALQQYEEPVIGEARLLNAPNFKKLPPNELVQLAYLRARAFEAEGKQDAALDDYYRVFTLGYGSNLLLTQQAMEAAIRIHGEDPRLAREESSAVAQMQSLAYLFSRRFGSEALPVEFQKYAEAPAVTPPSLNEAAVEAQDEPDEGETPEKEGEEGAKGKAKGKAKEEA